MKKQSPLRKTPMKRSGFKSKTKPVKSEEDTWSTTKPPKTPKKRKGLQPRSEKTKREYVYRKDLVASMLFNRKRCEAGQRILGFMRLPTEQLTVEAISNVSLNPPTGHTDHVERNGKRVHTCLGISVDVHEVLARSAGGSILDLSNCITVCRSCHDWIGDHPIEAVALGLRASRYLGRDKQWAIEQLTGGSNA